MAANAAFSDSGQRTKQDDEDPIIVVEEKDIQVQFWGLPEHYKTKDLGWKLKCSFGEVLDVDIFQVRGKEHIIVKVQVTLDITRPIKRALRIVGPNKKVLEVGLKYERIGNLCNYCGYVGHEARMYSFQLDDSLKGEVKEERWDEWLKSDQSGRRENHTEDNFDSKVPINEKSR
ncbi:uncharacterized protein LOC107606909 [Arachis ipaensis]|uniref:uncharacterized protein LOC107606909 n=1 Tax=Arachis ipaensis TaxID=130454 RepID=UPI0007AFE1D3|nr:uncharacterized protein LOC107606909 [Arachis ipaensis]XP_025664576.1 uncharacterized protein LOC112763011 [Arachis hypogaea]